MLYALVAALFLFVQPAQAAMECDTTPESKIVQTIQDEPNKLIKILEGHDLELFFVNMVNSGYMVGTLPGIDKIYIVDAGKRQGYTTDNVWLFFIQDGCLIASIPATKSIVLGLLP